MKKRLMCLIMCLILVLPIILSSCGEELTPQQIADANFQKADKALTLALWLPTNAVVDDNFNDRLSAVEAEINDYLRTNNYSTELDINAINENEYYEKLSNRFAEIKEKEKTQGTAYLTANGYVNHSKLNKETGIYELEYPKVLDTQLDLFFVGGYDKLVSYVDNGDTYELNSYFASGNVFSALFKKIRTIFLEATKIGGKYYAVPNNHMYAEKGQYILVDKDLYDSTGETWNDGMSLYSLEDFINSIGSKTAAGELKNVVPYVGTADDIPGVVYLDKENLIAGAYRPNSSEGDSFKPEFVYNLDEFKQYQSFYKTLSEKNYASNALSNGKKAAVQVLSATSIDIAKYADTHYVIESIPMYADIDSLYSSMFAISKHSANYDRAMQILYLLQDNEVIRTLLQYGIEEVDYEIKEINGENVLSSKNTAYKMNLLYTGNCYRTYPDNGQGMNYWDAIKDANLKVQKYPYVNFDTAVIRGDISGEDLKKIEEKSNALSNSSKQLLNEFLALSATDFSTIYDNLNYDLNEIIDKISSFEAKIKTAQESITEKNEQLSTETDEEKIKAIKEEIASLEEEISNYQGEIENLNSDKVIAEKYAVLAELVKSKDRKALLDLYISAYNTSNK